MPTPILVRSVNPFTFERTVQQCLDILLIIVPIFWFLGFLSVPEFAIVHNLVEITTQKISTAISAENQLYISTNIAAINERSPVSLQRIAYFVSPFVLAPLVLVGLMIVTIWYGLVVWLIFKFLRIREEATYQFSFTLALLSATWWFIINYGLTNILEIYTRQQLNLIQASTGWIDTTLRIIHTPFIDTIFVVLMAILFYYVWVKDGLKRPSISETNPLLVTQSDEQGFSKVKTKWQKK